MLKHNTGCAAQRRTCANPAVTTASATAAAAMAAQLQRQQGLLWQQPLQLQLLVVHQHAYMSTCMHCMQVGDLGREENYNYELQYSRFFDEEKTIMHGDMVSSTCVFNTMDNTEPAYGGLSSQEEMCVNFVLVYPASCCAFLRSRLSCIGFTACF